jgi:hypothetical protein
MNNAKFCQCGIEQCTGHIACTHPPGSAMCDICTLDPNDHISQQAIAADALGTRAKLSAH